MENQVLLEDNEDTPEIIQEPSVLINTEVEENPLYLSSENISDKENPLYDTSLISSSVFDEPRVNTTMSYISSINEDLSLVNLYENINKTATQGLRASASEQATLVRQELANINKTLASDFASKGAVDAVERAVTQLQAVSADIYSTDISTYQDVKESAQKTSESLLAIQALSKKTGKSVEDITAEVKLVSKNLAIRSTMESIIGSLEERRFLTQLAMEIIPLQTLEDVTRLLPTINSKLEDFGFSDNVLTLSTAQNKIQEALQIMPEKDAVDFLMDLKTSLVDSVGEKDARRFITKLLEQRKDKTDIALEVGFAALDAQTIAAIARGAVRGASKLARPSNVAVATGNGEAVAKDLAESITTGKPSILGHPNPLEEAVSLSPELQPNGFHQLSRSIQEKLGESVKKVKDALQSSLPASGVSKEDVISTIKKLEKSYDPLTNKSIRQSTLTPDLNTMRVNMEVIRDNKGFLFNTAEEAANAYKGKLAGNVEIVEVTEESAKTVKKLKIEVKQQIKALEADGIVLSSKNLGEAPVTPLKNMDSVPVSKQSKVEALNDIIQTSALETKSIALTIDKAEKIAKVPRVLKTAKPKYLKNSIEFSSILDKAIYITKGYSFIKRAAALESTAVDKEMLSWVKSVTKNLSSKELQKLRDKILDTVKTTQSVNGVISIPSVSKIPIEPISDLLKQKWIDLRKTVKEYDLQNTNDATKVLKAVDTPLEEKALSFSAELSKAESLVNPSITKEITKELQTKLNTLEETVRLLEEAKAGRFQEKGYAVKQKYQHPVFTDNNLAKLSDEELNATHGAVLSFMNPALGAAKTFYETTVVSVMKKAKLGKAWADSFKDFPKLSAAEKKSVTQALVKGDSLQVEYTPFELASEFGVTSENAVEAYYRYRTARNVLHQIKDKELADDLIASGWKQAKVKMLNKDGTDQAINDFIVKPIDDIKLVDNKRAYSTITNKGTLISVKSLTNGARVLEVKGGFEFGKTAYKYIIVEPNKVGIHDVVSAVGKKQGTFSRIYTDEYWVKVKIPLDDSGKNFGHRAFRTATSLQEAEEYVGGLKQLQAIRSTGAPVTREDVLKHLKDYEATPETIADEFNKGEFDGYSFEFSMHNTEDAFFRNSVFAGGVDPMDGKLYFSNRGDNAIPSISQKSLEANVADPFESLQREIANTVNFVSATEMRRNLIQKWYNTFSDIVPDSLRDVDAERTFANVANNLSGLRGFESTRQGQMIAQLKYVLGVIGVEHPVEKAVRTLSVRAINGFEKGMKTLNIDKTPYIKNIPGILRKMEPVNYARYIASHAMLGLLSPRQIIVQSSGMLYTSLLHPIHGPKAAFSIKPLLTAYASDSPDVWKWASRLASEKEMGMSTSDFARVAGAMKRIGLLDNIGATTVNEGADAVSHVLKKTKQRFDAASFFLFNKGEAINRVGAFDTARRVWSAQNPGLVWDSTENLPKVLALADTFTGNMTKAAEATYQKGLLAIPTQFLQYGLKSTANFAAGVLNTARGALGKGYKKGLTPKEMFSVMIAAPAMYGLDNLGLSSFYDEYLGEFFNNATDEQKQYFSQGTIAGIMNSVALATTGQKLETAIGKMTSPFSFPQELAEAVFDGSFELQSFTGPFGGVLESVYGVGKQFTVLFDRKDVTPSDVAALLFDVSGKTTSVGRGFYKAYLMSLNDGFMYDNQGQLISVASDLEIIAKASGFTLTSEAMRNKIYKSNKEYQDAMKDTAKVFKQFKVLEYEAIYKNDLEGARIARDRINTLMNQLSETDRRTVLNYVKDSPDFRNQSIRYFLQQGGSSRKSVFGPGMLTPPANVSERPE